MRQKLVELLQKLPWSLRIKLGLAFGLILLCFFINGIASAFLLYNIDQTTQRQKAVAVYLERLERYQLAYQSQLQIYPDTIFVTKVSFIRDNFKDLISDGLNQHNQDDADVGNQEFEAAFTRLYRIAYEHFFDLNQLINQSQFEQARLNWQQFQGDFERVTNLLTAQHQLLVAERDQSQQAITTTTIVSYTILIVLTLLSLALALGLLWLIERVVTRPLKQLQQALDQVAQGNLDQQPGLRNRDEVGKLAQSFEQAVAALRQVLQGVQIGQELQQMGGYLINLSQQQAEGASQQVVAVHQVTTAMEELSQTAICIANSAVEVAQLNTITLLQLEEAAQASQLSQGEAQQMVEVVIDTLSSIQQISHQVQQFHQQMIDLTTQSSSINKVVQIVDDLAQRVRLLALNAAIEAVSAGEYGERFQAVAREVKVVANQANSATDEARRLIKAVQNNIQMALVETEAGQTQVIKIVEATYGLRPRLQTAQERARQVEQAVRIVLEQARHASEEAEKIKEATYQQRLASEQIIIAAQSVGIVADQTASASHQLAANSSQLAQLTGQLNGVLGQVRLAEPSYV
jgi:methyl-accepting chemotaxis protein